MVGQNGMNRTKESGFCVPTDRQSSGCMCSCISGTIFQFRILDSAFY
jgi:hypothetical protein